MRFSLLLTYFCLIYFASVRSNPEDASIELSDDEASLMSKSNKPRPSKSGSTTTYSPTDLFFLVNNITRKTTRAPTRAPTLRTTRLTSRTASSANPTTSTFSTRIPSENTILPPKDKKRKPTRKDSPRKAKGKGTRKSAVRADSSIVSKSNQAELVPVSIPGINGTFLLATKGTNLTGISKVNSVPDNNTEVQSLYP